MDMSPYTMHLLVLFIFLFHFSTGKEYTGRHNISSLTESVQVTSRMLCNYMKSKNLVNIYIGSVNNKISLAAFLSSYRPYCFL